eukprot:17180-Heterococcus_DN1.PRE.4
MSVATEACFSQCIYKAHVSDSSLIAQQCALLLCIATLIAQLQCTLSYSDTYTIAKKLLKLDVRCAQACVLVIKVQSNCDKGSVCVADA